MSALLIGLAAVVAVLSVPSVAAILGMGLAGGDGEPKSTLLGVLGALVAYGSMVTAGLSIAGFWGLAPWQWWLMLVPPAAGLLGLLLSFDRDDGEAWWQRIGWLAAPLVLAVPAGLVLAGDAVSG